MGKLNSITINKSGTYYTTIPTVVIDPPNYDSGRFGGTLDSANFQFGSMSIKHDSDDVTTLDPLIDSGTGLYKFVSQSFWFYLDSLEPCTLTWSENFRVFVNNNNKLNIAFTVDSSQKDGFQTENIQVREHSTHFVQANKWHFAKIETNINTSGSQGGLRIGLDSNYSGTWAVHPVGLYDSGAVIRIGFDSGYTGPQHLENIGGQYVTDSDINKSFTGNVDNFQFTIDSNKILYNNQFSNWRPDSAEETYEGLIPMIHETFDFKQAKGIAVLDGQGGVSSITITDSGDGYSTNPGIKFIGGSATDSDYDIGDTVKQNLANNVEITGEVQRRLFDSSGDSSYHIFLSHVGADDGKYHTFVTDGTLLNKTNNSTTGLTINNVIEVNKINVAKQNDEFSTISDDFLDFSEDNPFGDPENQ